MNGLEARVQAVLAHPVFHPLAVSVWLIPAFVVGVLLFTPSADGMGWFNYSVVCGPSWRGLGGVAVITLASAAVWWVWISLYRLMRRKRRLLASDLTFREFSGTFSWDEVVEACRSVRFRDVLAVNFSCWGVFYLGMGPEAFCAGYEGCRAMGGGVVRRQRRRRVVQGVAGGAGLRLRVRVIDRRLAAAAELCLGDVGMALLGMKRPGALRLIMGT